MSNKTKLKIGEFSKMMQVTVKTLRHYEQKGLLKELYEDGSHTPDIRQMDEKIKETEKQLKQLIARRDQLLNWRDSRKQITKMEKFSIQSLPEIIVASHREVIPNYAALGPYERFYESYTEAFRYIDEQGYKVVGHHRTCYIDGVWNQDDPEKWLSVIQIPIA